MNTASGASSSVANVWRAPIVGAAQKARLHLKLEQGYGESGVSAAVPDGGVPAHENSFAGETMDHRAWRRIEPCVVVAPAPLPNVDTDRVPDWLPRRNEPSKRVSMRAGALNDAVTVGAEGHRPVSGPGNRRLDEKLAVGRRGAPLDDEVEPNRVVQRSPLAHGTLALTTTEIRSPGSERNAAVEKEDERVASELGRLVRGAALVLSGILAATTDGIRDAGFGIAPPSDPGNTSENFRRDNRAGVRLLRLIPGDEESFGVRVGLDVFVRHRARKLDGDDGTRRERRLVHGAARSNPRRIDYHTK